MDSVWKLVVATLLAISVSGDKDDSDGWFAVSGDSIAVTNDRLQPPIPFPLDNGQNVTTDLHPLNVSDVDNTTTELPPVTMGNEDNTTIHVRMPTATISLENTTTGLPPFTEGDVENTTNEWPPATIGNEENTTLHIRWPTATISLENTTTGMPSFTEGDVENTTNEWPPATIGNEDNTTIHIRWPTATIILENTTTGMPPFTEGDVENTTNEWPPATTGNEDNTTIHIRWPTATIILENTTTGMPSFTEGDVENTTTEWPHDGDEETTTSGMPLVTSTLSPGDNVTRNDMPPLSQDEEIELLKIETETIKKEIKGINTDIGALDMDIKEIQQRMDDLHLETEWGEWGPFSSCSQTCVSFISDELGVQTRSRDCHFKTPPLKATIPICEGEAIETIDCKADNYCYELPAPKNESEYIGSDQGDYFSDEYVWGGKNITAIRIRCGDVAVSIQAMYGSTWGPIHGWNESCNDSSVAFFYPFNGIPEYITMIDVKYGTFLETFQIHTNMRKMPVCGPDSYGIPAKASGTRLMYLEGKTVECHLAGIQPIWSVE